MKNVQLSPEDRERLVVLRNDIHEAMEAGLTNARYGKRTLRRVFLSLIMNWDKILNSVDLGQTRAELAKILEVKVEELDGLACVTIEEEGGGESDVNVQACLRECLDY